MDVNGFAGAEGWDQQPDQHDHFMGMMKGKGKGYYPKGGYGSSKVGKNDEIRAKEQKVDSREEEEKDGILEDGAPKEKGKECKQCATTADKWDTQLDCARNRQRKEKGKA